MDQKGLQGIISENFTDHWSQLLTHIELAAKANNAEMSLAALKNMQDLLFGRQQQTEPIGRAGKQSSTGGRYWPGCTPLSPDQ